MCSKVSAPLLGAELKAQNLNGFSDPVNLYDDDVIRDPWPHYERLRELGPVVWIEALGNYAFTQYDTV